MVEKKNSLLNNIWEIFWKVFRFYRRANNFSFNCILYIKCVCSTSVFHFFLTVWKTSYSESISFIAVLGQVCWPIRTKFFTTVTRHDQSDQTYTCCFILLVLWDVQVVGERIHMMKGSLEKTSDALSLTSGCSYCSCTCSMSFLSTHNIQVCSLQIICILMCIQICAYFKMISFFTCKCTHTALYTFSSPIFYFLNGHKCEICRIWRKERENNVLDLLYW